MQCVNYTKHSIEKSKIHNAIFNKTARLTIKFLRMIKFL